MCVIIIKEKADVICRETLENSARINPHGLGITYLDTYETTYHESTEYELLLTERPFIAHFRLATVGKVGRDNTHPFVCGVNTDELLMQNGTIKGLGSKDKCDSKVLAEQLGKTPRDKWKAKLEKHDSRFVTINTKTKSYEVYNRDEYVKNHGVWYSKVNVLQTNRVAVYGTLKQGYGNNMRYLRDARFLGGGTTETKYPLVVEGLPYLLSEAGVGHNVLVDVFKVTDEVFADLDILEGHPNWYVRQRVPIKMDDGRVLKCWVYFNDTNDFRGAEHHESYESPTRPQPAPCNERIFNFDSHYAPPVPSNDESPFCVDCYNDLVKEEYPGGTFSCTGCGASFTEDEIIEFNY